MVQNQKKLIDANREEILVKYTDCAELRKITITNCLVIYFFKCFKFHCCSFCLIKKVEVNRTSVLPIFFFTS